MLRLHHQGWRRLKLTRFGTGLLLVIRVENISSCVGKEFADVGGGGAASHFKDS